MYQAIIIAFISIPTLSLAKIDLGQTWSENDRNKWYESSQGSRLIPLEWLLALEQSNSIRFFMSDENIEKFRYIPRDLIFSNHNLRLPIGFAVDKSDVGQLKYTNLRWKPNQSTKEPWVGMTCAACHTAKITYKGESMVVDGGPTLGDFQSFIDELNHSLDSTINDDGKFERFAKLALKKEYSIKNGDILKAALVKLYNWQKKIDALNHTDLRYGYGRLDAVGNILNKISLLAKTDNPPPNPADAPVSYPFLWNVPRLNKLQWNGMVEKKVLPHIRGN